MTRGEAAKSNKENLATTYNNARQMHFCSWLLPSQRHRTGCAHALSTMLLSSLVTLLLLAGSVQSAHVKRAKQWKLTQNLSVSVSCHLRGRGRVWGAGESDSALFRDSVEGSPFSKSSRFFGRSRRNHHREVVGEIWKEFRGVCVGIEEKCRTMTEFVVGNRETSYLTHSISRPVARTMVGWPIPTRSRTPRTNDSSA